MLISIGFARAVSPCDHEKRSQMPLPERAAFCSQTTTGRQAVFAVLVLYTSMLVLQPRRIYASTLKRPLNQLQMLMQPHVCRF